MYYYSMKIISIYLLLIQNLGTHWGNIAVKIHILQRFSYVTLHLCQGVWLPRMGNAIENHHDTFDSLQFVGNNVRYALINIIFCALLIPNLINQNWPLYIRLIVGLHILSNIFGRFAIIKKHHYFLNSSSNSIKQATTNGVAAQLVAQNEPSVRIALYIYIQKR